MLADGSNPEGVDPSPPLQWSDRTSFKDVRLVSAPTSPPAAKVRYHLAYNKIEYTLIDVKEFRQGKEKGRDYTAIPVLFVDGRQVNDSYIIVKHLTRALYGTEANEDWEAKLTYGLQLAMEVESFNTPSDWPILVTFGGFPKWFGYMRCILPLRKYAKNIAAKRAKFDDRFGPLKSAKEYGDEFRAAMGSAPFFGGEQVSAVDVSAYAIMVTWKKVPSVQRLVKECDLQAWWGRMAEKMPSVVLGDP